MAKLEERSYDEGVAQARGKTEQELAEWWRQRVALLAAIPTDVARAGALVPQMRQLSLLPADERRRQIKARMTAVVAAPSDQRQRLFAGVKLASAIDPALVRSDQELAQQLVSEVPGASEIDAQIGNR